MTRALVTGGGGFLGRRIAELLLERNWSVRVFGRREYSDLAAMGVECCLGDLGSSEAVRAACRDMDVVFHVASLTGVWGRRQAFFETNVKGTANVIHACIREKVERLVYTSTPSVVIGESNIEGGDESLPYAGKFLAPYPESKAIAERMVLDANGWDILPDAPPAGVAGEAAVRHLGTCAIRPHLIWGPRDPHLIPRIVSAAKARRLAVVGDGTNRVDLTYIDNAAQAHLLAADELAGKGRCAGKAYFVGDAEPVSLWPWINNLLSQLGVRPVTRRISVRNAYLAGSVLECIHTVLPCLGEPRMSRFVARQLSQSHWFSHGRARNDFGYEPIVASDDGLSRLIAWLRGSDSFSRP